MPSWNRLMPTSMPTCRRFSITAIRASHPRAAMAVRRMPHEELRLHSYQRAPVDWSAGLAVFVETQLGQSRCFRRKNHSRQGSPVSVGAGRPDISPRGYDTGLENERSAVVYPAAIHAAETDGIPGSCGR